MDGVRGRSRKGSRNPFRMRLRLIITRQDCIREFYKKIYALRAWGLFSFKGIKRIYTGSIDTTLALG
jgi:hypothetical protein